MARNRGKRPSASSGPSSKHGDQTKATDQAKGDALAKPLGQDVPTSVSQTISADEKAKDNLSKPSSVSTTTGSSNKSGPPSANVTSSPGNNGRPVAGTGSVPNANIDAAKKVEPAKKIESAKTVAGAGGGLSASSAAAGSAATGGSGGSGGFWPGLLGGLLGGAGVALAASIFWTGVDNLSELQSTAASLDSRLSAAESEVVEVGSLGDRLDVVESGGSNSEIANRLTDLEQQLAGLGNGLSGAAEGSTDDTAAMDNTAAMDERLAALQQQLAELTDKVEASSEAQQSAKEAMAALQGALPALETTLAEAGKQTVALGETTERLGTDVTTLTDRIGQTESQLDFIGGEYQRAAAMVVAIGDIDRSITRAEPFAAALESLSALGQDDPGLGEKLTVLEPMAAAGVPTLAGLKSSFGGVGSRILLAADGGNTLADQVSDNLFGIINMRPSGAKAEGDDSRAIVARTQAKLADDDLEGALAELAVLDGAAMESARDWVTDAKARLSADAAIRDLRAHAQSLLAKGS